MRKILDAFRYRHSTGLSLDATARALNISKGVVTKYIRLAGAVCLTWPLPDDLDDSALEKRLYRQAVARKSTYAERDYALVHQELKKKGCPWRCSGKSICKPSADAATNTRPFVPVTKIGQGN